ncbi:LCP family protein [Evansella sp. AB-rgal1]|uniref:LCP family protein n=1 Tax=Evansella sp. AB-rgal1 TaxID=3242696 RepID=UPI00359CD419
MKKTTITLKMKVLILILLLFILGGVGTAAWIQNDYQKARNESIRQIEESGKTVSDRESIEFNAPSSSEEVSDFINVLLVGLDDDDQVARTDTIMIAQYRPKDGEAKLVSLMRDMYVSIPGYRDNKLNSAFAYGGLELLRQTIKENFGINLHYYAQVNFDGFERIVDTVAPDGIEVDIPRRMYYRDGPLVIDFQPGIQTLDGDAALKYVRFRSDYQNDFGRVARQQEVLNILKNELLSVSGVTRIPQLLGSIEPYFHTNVETSKMLSYARDLFLNPVDKIDMLTIPLQGEYYDQTYDHAGAVLELHWDTNLKTLHEFLKMDEELIE